MKTLHLILWHLTTCLPVFARTPLPPPPPYDAPLDNGVQGYYPIRRHVTAEDPNFKTPVVNFLQWDPVCDDGLLTFLTPRGHTMPRPGPVIVDARGELIWQQYYQNDFGGEAYNFLVQQYKGEPHLTFWLGDDRVRGHGAGFYYILDSTYQVVQKIGAANGLSADLHEFLITPENTVMMTVYEIVPGDVSAFRDFHPEQNPDDQDPNWIWDGVLQEIDIDTGELIFEWRASEHVNSSETYRPVYGMGNHIDPFDWFHINSIQKDELGNYLVSARYTHSITYIDGRTKETIWQLGGKKNDFMDLSGGNATNFAWQHDARFRPLDTFPNIYTPPPERTGVTTKLLTLFDNAAEDMHYDYGLPISRGLLLEITYPTPGTEKSTLRPHQTANHQSELAKRDNTDLNKQKMANIARNDPAYTIRVIQSWENPQGVRSSSQGNVQLLPQGAGEDPKVLMGYGLSAVYTEYAANGTTYCDAHYGARTSWERGDVQSYRAYKFPWIGRPQWAPNAQLSKDKSMIFVSWLGATEIAEWVLQSSHASSENEGDWADALRVPKISFETTLVIPRDVERSRYLRMVAVGADGYPLDHGISKILARGRMAAYLPQIAVPKTVSHMTSRRAVVLVFLSLVGLFAVYEGYRRYLSWRMGRPGAGPLKWRKGANARYLV